MKRMVCLALALVLTVLFAPVAWAESTEDYYAEQLEESGAADLPEQLPQETQHTLEELGIDGTDWQALTSITPEALFSEIGGMAQENAQGPLQAAASVIAVMLLCALCNGMKLSLGEKQLGGVIGMVGALCVCTTVVGPVVACIEHAAQVVQAAAGFLLACVPVLAGIMLAAGQPVSAGSYNLLMMAVGNVISILSASILVPCLNIFLALSIVSAISPGVNLSGICNAFHKVVKWVLGFCMTVFAGLLTVHSIVASSMDETTAKAAKFVVSSFVPVVGSALGDALQTVTGCVKLLKSGVGAFGLLAGALIFLPVILQCLLWMVTLNVCAGAGDVFELKEITSLLRAIAKAVELILAIVLCCMTILTVSTAIVLLMGKGEDDGGGPRMERGHLPGGFSGRPVTGIGAERRNGTDGKACARGVCPLRAGHALEKPGDAVSPGLSPSKGKYRRIPNCKAQWKTRWRPRRVPVLRTLLRQS